MEPYAAVALTKNNKIFEQHNIETGIIIADNDNSSIAAIRNVHSHEIVKLDDKNHTSKGVVSALYKLQKKHKELTTPTIKYFQKCFNYSISKNIGNNAAMAAAIDNIPYHAYNMHANCGEWCSYKANPETYKHSNIGNGLTSPTLFDALQELFYNLSTNVDRYSAGASSNPNESFNSVIVNKAPKSRMYGMSASGDCRIVCAVLKKNDGATYISKVSEKLNMSPGKHTYKYHRSCEIKHKSRYRKSLTVTYKRRRLFLKQQKSNL